MNRAKELTFDELAAQLAAQLDRLRARYGDDIVLTPYQRQLRRATEFTNSLVLIAEQFAIAMNHAGDAFREAARQAGLFSEAVDKQAPPGLIDRVRLWFWERLP